MFNFKEKVTNYVVHLLDDTFATQEKRVDEAIARGIEIRKIFEERFTHQGKLVTSNLTVLNKTLPVVGQIVNDLSALDSRIDACVDDLENNMDNMRRDLEYEISGLEDRVDEKEVELSDGDYQNILTDIQVHFDVVVNKLVERVERQNKEIAFLHEMNQSADDAIAKLESDDDD